MFYMVFGPLVKCAKLIKRRSSMLRGGDLCGFLWRGSRGVIDCYRQSQVSLYREEVTATLSRQRRLSLLDVFLCLSTMLFTSIFFTQEQRLKKMQIPLKLVLSTFCVPALTMSSSLHLRSSSRDILFSCFLKYFLLAACRLNHVYANDFTCGSRASMNGWNSSWNEEGRSEIS